MNSIFDLGLYYKKGIHIEIYGYADLGDNLDNHRLTVSFYIVLLVSYGIVKNNEVE